MHLPWSELISWTKWQLVLESGNDGIREVKRTFSRVLRSFLP